MADYSFSNGLSVPVDVVKTIEAFSGSEAEPSTSYSPEQDADPALNGQPDIGQLVNAHMTLSSLVRPARPKTIYQLYKGQNIKSWQRFLGPVSIIRQMMIALIVSLAAFILLALMPQVSVGAGDILESDGLKLLLNLLFYIAAAGLGAGFAALYKANSYIAKGTFDSTYDASYRIRFCLGLIAGLVLSVMVSDKALHVSQGVVSGAVDPNANSIYGFMDTALLRPMLAMLGGFSADLLYTILHRLVETVESLFKGSTKNLIDLKQLEVDALLASSKVQAQIDLAVKLLKLQQQVGGMADPAEIQTRIDQLLNEVMPAAGQANPT